MRLSTLAKWVLRTLTLQGPQDFAGLIGLLKSDAEYGYIPLSDRHFEARLRYCLGLYSQDPERMFIQKLNYKWDVLKQDLLQDLDIPRKANGEPWITIGKGRESVYGIICPKTMRESYYSKVLSYPIKIGRTDRPIAARLSELQTGNFLDLQIGLVIKTNYSRDLEKYLHTHLSHRKLLGQSSQSEWFFSSLENVLTLNNQYSIAA